MGRLLDFKTRKPVHPEDEEVILPLTLVQPSVVEEEPVSPLFPAVQFAPKPIVTGPPRLDLFRKLYDQSAKDINGLVIFYKSTGRWNITAERLMARVVEDIKAICASVAGEQHGPKA